MHSYLNGIMYKLYNNEPHTYTNPVYYNIIYNMDKLDECKDQILNGLRSGMSLSDMYILAELDITDIERLEADTFFMNQCKAAPKLLEIDLLKGLQTIINVQKADGKESATVWLLEKMNPRWAGKTDVSKSGTVNINFGTIDLETEDSVEINLGKKAATAVENSTGA